MLGPDANWVGNVRVAGGRVVLRQSGRREAVALVEVDIDRRAPEAAFERIAARFPVFRVAGRAAAVDPPTRP